MSSQKLHYWGQLTLDMVSMGTMDLTEGLDQMQLNQKPNYLTRSLSVGAPWLHLQEEPTVSFNRPPLFGEGVEDGTVPTADTHQKGSCTKRLRSAIA